MRSRTAVAVLGAAGAGCGGGPTAVRYPADAAGTYVLATVERRALPFVLSDYQGYRYTLVVDTLTLAADGTYRRAQVMRANEAGHDTTYRNVQRGPYVLSGDSLTFPLPPCPPNANCVSNQAGTLRGDTISLSYFYGPDRVYRFGRVSD